MNKEAKWPRNKAEKFAADHRKLPMQVKSKTNGLLIPVIMGKAGVECYTDFRNRLTGKSALLRMFVSTWIEILVGIDKTL